MAVKGCRSITYERIMTIVFNCCLKTNRTLHRTIVTMTHYHGCSRVELPASIVAGAGFFSTSSCIILGFPPANKALFNILSPYLGTRSLIAAEGPVVGSRNLGSGGSIFSPVKLAPKLEVMLVNWSNAKTKEVQPWQTNAFFQNTKNHDDTMKILKM